MNVHKIFRPLLFAALLPLAAASSWGKEPGVDVILERLEAAEKDIRRLWFSYSQTTHIKVTDERETIKGEVHFAFPRKFKVEQKPPRDQIILSDGVTLSLYKPSARQMYRDSWQKWFPGAYGQGYIPFQRSVADMREQYDVTLSAQEIINGKSMYVLSLAPKKKSPWPYAVRLWVGEDDYFPWRTELSSASLLTTVDIAERLANGDFSDDVFDVNPPPGVEIINNPLGG